MSLVISRSLGCVFLPVSLSAVVIVLSACAFDATGLGLETGSGESGGAESMSADATGDDGESSTTTGGTTLSSAGSESAGSESGGASGTTTSAAETTGEASTSEASSGSLTGDLTASSTSTEGEPCDSPVTVYPDADDDTFGDPEGALETCDPPPGHVEVAGDCDDGKSSVFPGADEVCDGVDNDCDLKVDEYSAANSGACNDCKTVVAEDRVYYFCPDEDDRSSAVAWCAKRGAQLVSINSEGEFALVWSQIKSQAGDFWIGAGDMEEEGVYVWADGTPLSDEDPGWAVDEPMADGVLLELDCVVLGGGWFSSTPGRYQTAFCDQLIDPGWICEAELDD